MVSTTFDVNGGKGWRVQHLSETAAASVADANDYSCDCTCVAGVVAATASAADPITRCPAMPSRVAGVQQMLLIAANATSPTAECSCHRRYEVWRLYPRPEARA